MFTTNHSEGRFEIFLVLSPYSEHVMHYIGKTAKVTSARALKTKLNAK
jgi:hypothetical protein